MIATRLAIATFGTSAATVGAIALAGHLLKLPSLYQWPNDPVGMGVNTSISLLMLGVGATLTGLSEWLWKK